MVMLHFFAALSRSIVEENSMLKFFTEKKLY